MSNYRVWKGGAVPTTHRSTRENEKQRMKKRNNKKENNRWAA